MKTPKKHVNAFSISLLTFMTSHSQNRKLKLNSRAIRAVELLKILQNPLWNTKTLWKILKE